MQVVVHTEFLEVRSVKPVVEGCGGLNILAWAGASVGVLRCVIGGGANFATVLPVVAWIALCSDQTY